MLLVIPLDIKMHSLIYQSLMLTDSFAPPPLVIARNLDHVSSIYPLLIISYYC